MNKLQAIYSGVILILCVLSAQASEDGRASAMTPSIKESYVMLYYKDMQAPRKFYSEIFGLKATFEDEWVSLYRLTENSLIGVVKEGGTAYHKTQTNNAVMLSIVVDDVDAWNKKLKTYADVKYLKEIYNHDSVPIRAFLLEDPGGYTVEVFQWVSK